MELSIWNHLEIDGVIETNKSCDSQLEQQYPWRPKAIDDETLMISNNAHYPFDAEIDVNVSRRNVNMVEVNMGAGHATKGGRKLRNKDVSLTESLSQAGEEAITSDSMIDHHPKSAFDAGLSSNSASHQNTEEDKHSALKRTSSLKTIVPKTRTSNVTASSSRSNIPSRCDSTSPPKDNSANSNCVSQRRANAVNFYSQSLGPLANSTEQGTFCICMYLAVFELGALKF